MEALLNGGETILDGESSSHYDQHTAQILASGSVGAPASPPHLFTTFHNPQTELERQQFMAQQHKYQSRAGGSALAAAEERLHLSAGQQPIAAAFQRPAGAQVAEPNGEEQPLYVNWKQYKRILKRREVCALPRAATLDLVDSA